MKENSNPSNQEQDNIKRQCAELPLVLLAVLKIHPSKIHPQDAFFLFKGYAEMLELYDRYFFPENHFVHNAKVKGYRGVVRRFQSGITLEAYFDKAVQFIHGLEESQETLSNLADWLYYFKSADTKNTMSDNNLTLYFSVRRETERKLNEISRLLVSKSFDKKVAEKINWVKVMEARHSIDDMRFDSMLLDPVENQKSLERLWGYLKLDQQLRLGDALYRDYYQEGEADREFIRNSTVFSKAMVGHLVANKISLLNLYSREYSEQSNRLIATLEYDFIQNLLDELSELEPQCYRDFFHSRSLPKQEFVKIILAFPKMYRRLFVGISPLDFNDEVTKICHNPIVIEAAKNIDSEFSKWILQLHSTGRNNQNFKSVPEFNVLMQHIEDSKNLIDAQASAANHLFEGLRLK
jgi:hypothetical protein